MINVLKKNEEIIMYLIFGVLTTLINIFTFNLFVDSIKTSYIISNIIAWIVSVMFAFFTNKTYVFKSKNKEKNILIKEISSFFGARIFSLIVDMILMMLFVELLTINKKLAKIVVNIIVVIINYVLSKFIIFKKQN